MSHDSSQRLPELLEMTAQARQSVFFSRVPLMTWLWGCVFLTLFPPTIKAKKLHMFMSLTEDVKLKEEKLQRLQNELRHLLESLAIQLSSPTRFVETQEGSIRERLREVIQENKDRLTVCDKPFCYVLKPVGMRETWCLTLKKENGLRMCENKVLRIISGHKLEEGMGDLRKLHKFVLHNLCSS